MLHSLDYILLNCLYCRITDNTYDNTYDDTCDTNDCVIIIPENNTDDCKNEIEYQNFYKRASSTRV